MKSNLLLKMGLVVLFFILSMGIVVAADVKVSIEGPTTVEMGKTATITVSLDSSNQGVLDTRLALTSDNNKVVSFKDLLGKDFVAIDLKYFTKVSDNYAEGEKGWLFSTGELGDGVTKSTKAGVFSFTVRGVSKGKVVFKLNTVDDPNGKPLSYVTNEYGTPANDFTDVLHTLNAAEYTIEVVEAKAVIACQPGVGGSNCGDKGSCNAQGGKWDPFRKNAETNTMGTCVSATCNTFSGYIISKVDPTICVVDCSKDLTQCGGETPCVGNGFFYTPSVGCASACGQGYDDKNGDKVCEAVGPPKTVCEGASGKVCDKGAVVPCPVGETGTKKCKDDCTDWVSSCVSSPDTKADAVCAAVKKKKPKEKLDANYITELAKSLQTYLLG